MATYDPYKAYLNAVAAHRKNTQRQIDLEDASKRKQLYLSQQNDRMNAGAFSRGVAEVGSSMNMFGNLITGDEEGAAREIERINRWRNRNPSSVAGQELSAAWEEGDGIYGGIAGVGEEISKDIAEADGFWETKKAITDNLSAMGGGIIKQLPNAALSVGGAVGGGLIAGVPGALAGASIGTTVATTGEMAEGELESAGVDRNSEAAVEDFFDKEGTSILGKSLLKGTIIGATDVATMGAASQMFKAPLNAAINRQLLKRSIKPENIKDEIIKEDFKKALFNDPVYLASQKPSEKLFRNVGAAALEPVGEFTGEFVGEGLATGEFKPKDAALEAFTAVGQSAITTAGVKSYAGATAGVKLANNKIRGNKTRSPSESARVDEAIVTGDVSSMLNPENQETYNPLAAVDALIGNNQLETTTPEAREANISKAQDILAGLESDAINIEDRLFENRNIKANIAEFTAKLNDPKATPEAKAEYRKIIEALEEQDTRNTKDPLSPEDIKIENRRLKTLKDQIKIISGSLEELITNTDTPTDIKQTIEEANSSSPTTTEEATKSRSLAISKTIRMIQKGAESIDIEVVDKLVNNTSNALTGQQRDYLRGFSEARKAQNKVTNISIVSGDIGQGNQTANNNKGIKQFRALFNKAAAARNRLAAYKELIGLQKFYKGHKNKQAVLLLARKQVSASKGKSKEVQVHVDEDGKWFIANEDQKFKGTKDEITKQLRERGFLLVHKNSNKLISAVNREVEALNKSTRELALGYELLKPVTEKKKTKPEAKEEVTEAEDKEKAPEVTETKTKLREEETKVVEPIATKEKDLPKKLSEMTGEETAADMAAEPVAEATKEEAIDDSGTETITVYDPLGNAQELPVVDRSEAGTVIVKTADGNEVIVGQSEFFEDDINDPNFKLSRGSKNSVSELDDAALETALKKAEKRRKAFEEKGATNQAGYLEAIRDRNAIKTEQKRRAAPAKTEGAIETENTDTAEETLGLGIMTTGKAKVKNVLYLLRNLVADFFTQSAGDVETGTRRPLVVVKDFVTTTIPKNINDNWEGLLSFLPDGRKLNDEQKQLFVYFGQRATEWRKLITDSLQTKYSENSEEYKYQDLMRFFITEAEDGTNDIEENIKTAIAAAAFAWINSTAARKQINGHKEINSLLGRPEGTLVTSEEFAMFSNVGDVRAIMIEAMGRSARQALGLKPSKDAPVNLVSNMDSILGWRVYSLLKKLGYVEETEYTAKQIREVIPGFLGGDRNIIYYTKLAKEENGSDFVEGVGNIVSLMQGTQSIFETLFKVTNGVVEPTTVPEEFKQTEVNGSKVPAITAKRLSKENTIENYIHPGMWQLINVLKDDIFYQIAGGKTEEQIKELHVAQRFGAEASNDGIRRDIANFKGYVTGMFADPEGITRPIFFNHVMRITQRVGIVGTIINPVASKIHRNLVYRSKWDSEVNRGDTESWNNFLLRVGEGFGVTTGMQGNEKSLEQIREILRDETLVKAIAAVAKVLSSDSDTKELSAEDQKSILEATLKGKEQVHTLAAILALAQDKVANDKAIAEGKGKDYTFKTQLMSEVDGKTNGPILSRLLLGAAEGMLHLRQHLTRGGLFTKTDEPAEQDKNLNEWLEQPGNNDLYQSLSAQLQAHIRGVFQYGEYDSNTGQYVPLSPNAKLKWTAISSFTGRLVDPDTGKVTSTGRNFVKTPATSVAFGSSIPKIVDNMFVKFLQGIYERITKDAKEYRETTDEVRKEDIRLKLINDLNDLLGSKENARDKYTLDTSMDALLNEPLLKDDNNDHIESFRNTFTTTIGKSIGRTMYEYFNSYLATTKLFNTGANVTFTLYDSAFEQLRQEEMERQMDLFTKHEENPENSLPGIGIPWSLIEGKRQPKHELSSAQLGILREKVEEIFPIMHSHMSKESDDISAGLVLPTNTSEKSERKSYGNSIKYIDSEGNKRTVSVGGREFVLAESGVRMLPLTTHSTDSAIMLAAADRAGIDLLNLYDAAIVGVNDLVAISKILNEELLHATMSYAPAMELNETLDKTVIGLSKLVEKGLGSDSDLMLTINDRLYKAYGTEMGDPNIYALNSTLSFDLALKEYLQDYKTAAIEGTRLKLEYLLTTGVINQYSLEDGGYVLTDVDRENIQAELDKLPNKKEISGRVLSTKTLNAIKVLANAYKKSQDAKENTSKTVEAFGKVLQTPEGPIAQMELDLESGFVSEFGEVGKAPQGSSNAKLVKFFGGLLKDKQGVRRTTAKSLIKTLKAIYATEDGKALPNSAFNRKLLIRLAKVLTSTRLKINYIEKDTDPNNITSGVGPEGGMAWYFSGEGAHEINILSDDFVNSEIKPEHLLHELFHASVTATLESTNPTVIKEIAAARNDLEKLRQDAKEFIESNSDTLVEYDFENAVSNLDEFIAYGMTDVAFQETVLLKMTTTKESQLNTNVPRESGFMRFAAALRRIFFRGYSGKDDKTIVTGVETLIHNVSNILEVANANIVTELKAAKANSKPVAPTKKKLKGETDAVDGFSTTEVFAELDDGSLTPEFQDHLRQLLEGMVTKLHGSWGSFKESMEGIKVTTPLDVWVKALEKGKAPFASDVLASGFSGNAQENFVIEQVEATIRAAIDTSDNTVTSTQLRAQLRKLYTETKNRLEPKDFLGAKFGTSTMKEAEALYNFVFTITPNATDSQRSNYLSRFAALGLAHKEFNKLLQVATERDVVKKPETFFQRLQNIFQKILGMFERRISNIREGQPADERLTTLVEQLVDIESKRKQAIKTSRVKKNDYANVAEDTVKATADKVTGKVGEILRSDTFRNSPISFIRLVGSVGGVAIQGQVNDLLNEIIAFRNSTQEGQLGGFSGFINNVKGPKEGLKLLVRARKRLEGLVVRLIGRLDKQVTRAYISEQDAEAKAAISAVLLRTGVHNLYKMGLVKIESLLGDVSAISVEIKKLEDSLDVFGKKLKKDFIEDAMATGWYTISGEATKEYLKFNAHQISRRAETGKHGLTKTQLAKADEINTQLISLYALLYAAKAKGPAGNPTLIETQLQTVKEILKEENARQDDGNGVQFTLDLHRGLEAQALVDSFQGDPFHMEHGYLPEIYNNRTETVAANEMEGAELLDLGYNKLDGAIPLDAADPNQEVRHLYVLEGGGISKFLTSSFGFGSEKAKGTLVHDAYTNPNSIVGRQNALAQAQIKIYRNKHKQKRGAGWDPMKEKENFMVPVYKKNGGMTTHRYLMNTMTKNKVLERTNSYSRLLGELAGSIQGKKSTVVQNKIAVAAIFDEYQTSRARSGSKAFMLVGSKSTDPELKAIWDRLPQQTRDDVTEIWGREGMWVRKDSIDILFGYSKISAADPFKRASKERSEKQKAAPNRKISLSELDSINFAQKVVIGVVETLLINQARLRGKSIEEAERYAKRAGAAIARGEDYWKSVVTEIKDILVVKTGFILAGNISSNYSMLYLQGVPTTEMVKSTLVALRGALDYKSDTEELEDLRTLIATGYTQGKDIEINQRIIELQDQISRNPVTELMDAGMMPTIVDDVDMSEDPYSVKSKLTEKVDKLTTKLHPTAKSWLRLGYMTRDTKWYQGMAYATQMSDFTARYAMYKHQTTRQKNPLSKAEALERASNAFVNYDIPLHRWLQYTDDMGLTMFTKYFLYIQGELMKVTKENPGRVLSLLLFNSYFDAIPTIQESSMLTNIGDNPIRGGAFGLPNTIIQLPMASAALAIVK